MRKLEIIGLAIVAATAFGVWSASTVAQSRVGKADVLAARAPISPHAIMVKLGSSLPVGILVASLLSDIAASEPLVIRPLPQRIAAQAV